MKKILTLFVAPLVAMSCLVSACGSNAGNETTPVDEMISQMDAIFTESMALDESGDDMDLKAALSLLEKLSDLQTFAKENADYAITDADRTKLKGFMKELGAKNGESLTDEDLAEIDDVQTLGDFLGKMDLDEMEGFLE